MEYIQNEDEALRKCEEIWLDPDPSSPTEQFEAMIYATGKYDNKMVDLLKSSQTDLSDKVFLEIRKYVDRFCKNVMSFTEQNCFPLAMEVFHSKCSDFEIKNEFSNVFSTLILGFSRQGNIVHQKEYAEKYFEYASKLTQKYPVAFFDLLSDSFVQLHHLCRNEGDTSGAKKYAERVIELITNISDEKTFESSLELILSEHPSPETSVRAMQRTLYDVVLILIEEGKLLEAGRYSEIKDLIENLSASTRKRKSFGVKDLFNNRFLSPDQLKKSLSNRWKKLGFVDEEDNIDESFDEDHVPDHVLGCIYEFETKLKAMTQYMKALETLEENEPKAEFCYCGLVKVCRDLKDNRSALK